MNPSSNQKDNELISGNPTIKKNRKQLFDSEDQDKININQPKESNKLTNDIAINDPENKKSPIQHSFLDSEDNKQNPNIVNNTVSFKVTPEYIESIKAVMNQTKKLQIKIAVSTTLERGTILEIDPLGLKNSIRQNAGDGLVYFGFLTDEELADYNTAIDFLIKPKEENYETRFKGRHFQIRFNPFDLKYYICDLGNGFGTFVKLTEETVIKDNYLINLGNAYIVLIFEDLVDNTSNTDTNHLNMLNANNPESVDNNTMGSTRTKNEKILILKIFSGNERVDPIYCNPNDKKKYLIGRDECCDVVMDDSLLSRVHCTVIYRENYGWCILDGHITEEDEIHKSTNGTWLYLMEETEVVNGMVFKGNQNVFKCNYV